MFTKDEISADEVITRRIKESRKQLSAEIDRRARKSVIDLVNYELEARQKPKQYAQRVGSNEGRAQKDLSFTGWSGEFPDTHPFTQPYTHSGPPDNVHFISHTMEAPGSWGNTLQVVIPTLVDGVKLSDDEAIKRAETNGFNNYPAFISKWEADAWAENNYGLIGTDGRWQHEHLDTGSSDKLPLMKPKWATQPSDDVSVSSEGTYRPYGSDKFEPVPDDPSKMRVSPLKEGDKDTK